MIHRRLDSIGLATASPRAGSSELQILSASSKPRNNSASINLIVDEQMTTVSSYPEGIGLRARQSCAGSSCESR